MYWFCYCFSLSRCVLRICKDKGHPYNLLRLHTRTLRAASVAIPSRVHCTSNGGLWTLCVFVEMGEGKTRFYLGSRSYVRNNNSVLHVCKPRFHVRLILFENSSWATSVITEWYPKTTFHRKRDKMVCTLQSGLPQRHQGQRETWDFLWGVARELPHQQQDLYCNSLVLLPAIQIP